MSKTDTIEVTGPVPASIDAVYSAWLDGQAHTAMTGGAATCEARVGGRFTAWDDYIEGENLELEAPHRIVQAWRSSEFPSNAPASRLEVLLKATEGGTQLTLRHSGIPAGQGASYEQGWVDHYLEPMRVYFSK